MRDYLRRTADRIWVIDCSPEGHQPDVPTRIFQGVQQPVCIVMAARSKQKAGDEPAVVKYTVLPAGKREEKFAALAKLKLEAKVWQNCPTDWRGPFLPAATGDWASYPALDDLFAYNGSGVQPKRVGSSLRMRNRLDAVGKNSYKLQSKKRKSLFHATLRGGKPADRHIRSVVRIPLPGYELRPLPIVDEKGPCPTPVPYGFRSFDRQWIIPDPRVITQPNADLWRSFSDRQVYVTAPSRLRPRRARRLLSQPRFRTWIITKARLVAGSFRFGVTPPRRHRTCRRTLEFLRITRHQ